MYRIVVADPNRHLHLAGRPDHDDEHAIDHDELPDDDRHLGPRHPVPKHQGRR